ncbi:Tex family protein [Atopobacter phocae]|uniref:Tex family protein n=1 Tax=Atopobacter phocae TaxID=136492 RepID=UPI0004723891|nr:Tex family protein [Atopobacter phocae]
MHDLIMNQLQHKYKNISAKHLKATIDMILEGNTVPFIARYRKDQTGNLNEVDIKSIADDYDSFTKLEERRKSILNLIQEQDKLTPELKKEIQAAKTLQELEDLYRPYKQKKQTKATIAREKGLTPLAELIMTQPTDFNLLEIAATYINPEQDLETTEDVIEGVHEILAEDIGDEPKFRRWIRQFTFRTGILQTKLRKNAKDEMSTYEMYYDFTQPISNIADHQTLAINRAEREKIISVSIEVDMEALERYFSGRLITNKESAAQMTIKTAYQDSYKRFIGPAIEREIRKELTERAEAGAIHLFGENLTHLLLQPPLTGEIILGWDPAFRTGCKLAIIDTTGKVLRKEVIYPHKPSNKERREAAKEIFKQLLTDYHVTCVAIGNGTASRESEQFVSDQIKEMSQTITYTIVNEAGASVYSASALAREEFPDYEVEERSAVSIARRLQDPLAELIKIDPKAVGVGQYQHDVNQKALSDELDFVVLKAVNTVGVDLNTASPTLLEHVSGLNKTIARNIIDFRNEIGHFTQRNQLKKVKRLGAKTFEQAAGFLRIPNGEDAFDNTAIHPESYKIAQLVLKELNLSTDLLGSPELQEALTSFDHEKFAQEHQVGPHELNDILEQFKKPGRDPREDAPKPILREDVLKMSDLSVGMQLLGTVRNVVDFGAFVDIGVKQDGLVHISRLSSQFINHPSNVVSVGDIVTVYVDELDVNKKRIGLSMIPPKRETKN